MAKCSWCGSKWYNPKTGNCKTCNRGDFADAKTEFDQIKEGL